MSLGEKALGGFFWTFLSNVGVKITTFVFGVILARLLDPTDFGMVAMLYIFFEVSTSVVDSGFSQALIRKEKVTEEDKGTTFFINLIVAIVFYIIIYLSAPAIARFYNNELLVDLVRVMGLTIVVQSVSIVQNASIVQGLAFKKLSSITLIASVISGIVGVVLAFYGYGVWSLAYRYVVLALLTSVLLYTINPWYPKYFIVKESFHSLFGFGSKLFLSGLLNTIYRNIYKLIIGKFFSAATLGLFTQAKLYVSQVTQSAVGTLQTVTYPILSKAKDDPVRLKEAYRKIILASSYVIFPVTIGLGLLAEPFILSFVGVKWIESVPFLQVLCLSGALYHLHSINLNILKVMGRSDLFLKLEIIKKINTTIAIVIGLQFGIWGLLIGSVVSSYVALVINMYYTRHFINYSYFEQFSDLIPLILHSIPMILSVYFFMYFSNLPNILTLTIGIFIGVAVYLLTTFLIKSKALIHIVDLLSTKIPSLKKLNI